MRAAAALLSFLLAGPAMAASAATEAPPALRVALQQGMKIHKSFEGPGGLTGWVLLRKDDEPVIVFTTADGKTVLAGPVLDEQGRNLVAGYAEQHAPKADFTSFLPELSRAPAIVQGDAQGTQVLYVFFDPTCPFCNLAYGTFKTKLKAGTQLRWIPIEYLSPKAAGQAAALLASRDPSTALAEHEASFKAGGIAAAEVTGAVRRQLDANLELFQRMRFKGVPAIVYRTDDGRWDALSGAPGPEDLPRLLAAGR